MADLIDHRGHNSLRNTVPAILVVIAISWMPTQAFGRDLPMRVGPPIQTTSGVPHVQIGVTIVPEVNTELMRRVSALPKVDIRPTVVSLPGATGFWLHKELQLERPDAIVGGREFAHIHPDGSLHASLPPNRAKEAIEAGWAVLHPWANQRSGWEGFVMLYTPQSKEQSKVVFRLIVDSYNFITGQKLEIEPKELTTRE